MKIKTKHSTKISAKGASGITRTTQKTFIIVALLAYATYSFMMLHDMYRMLTSGYAFDMSPFLVYAIPAVLLPLLAFIVLYLLSDKKSTKLWKTFQATFLALLVVIAYGVIMSLTNAVFQHPLSYGTPATALNTILVQLIPPVLALLLAAGLGWWLRIREQSRNDISPKGLKVLIISLLTLIILQSAVSFIGFNGAGTMQPYDSGMLAIAFMGFAVPVVAIAILYFVTSRIRTRVQRIFIATIYFFIGILVTMTTVSLWFQLASLVGVGAVGSFLDSMSAWIGLAIFIGIVIWHRVIKAI